MPVATGGVLAALAPLREMLSPWPAGLPSRPGERLLPLRLGVHADIVARLSAGANPRAARKAASRYFSSLEYRTALAQQGSQRHDLDGSPVGEVSEEHRSTALDKRSYATQPGNPAKESFVMAVTVKALKVTAVLDPKALRPAPLGADVTLDIKTDGGVRCLARLNAKSYRKAMALVAAEGADNVTVVVQGRMVRDGEIVDAGISATVKAKTAG